LSIEKLQERHHIYGGVARFVFHNDLTKIMKRALADFKAVQGGEIRVASNRTESSASVSSIIVYLAGKVI